MKKVKFLHCADIHLDAPFTSLGSYPDKGHERRQDLKLVFNMIIDIARDEKVDVLLISGDLYEHSYVKKSTINFINDKFKEISDIKIFIVPGNHDPGVPNSFYRSYNWADNVYVLSQEKQCIVLDDLEACVYGIGFRDFSQEAVHLKNIELVHPGYINILLLHGTVDMDIKPGKNSYNPVSSADLACLNMDYIALGHFHNRIDDIGGFGRAYNPGSPEPLGFDEEGEHGVYVGTITRDGAEESRLDIRFITLGRKYYINDEINISGCNTNEQIIDRIDRKIRNRRKHDLSKGLFNITLKGYTEFGFKVDIQQILSHFNDKLFFLKIKDETVLELDLDEIKAEPGLRGLFVRKMLDMINKEKDEHQKNILARALYYGIEALENGKVEIN